MHRSREKQANEKIDFVLTWVDGMDPDWISERQRYRPDKGSDTDASRYRDWDNLQYWFRGVEAYASWVNKIYFVTWGHLPKWLNTNHPKLKIINHRDFMKAEFLPTFNINPIELNLHRIEGISDQFVFFNDDMFLIDSIQPSDFFFNGLPRDCCIETALVQDDVQNPFAHILMNDAGIVNMHFNKQEIMKNNWRKWFSLSYGKYMFRNILMLPYKKFSSFKYTHLPSAFLKETFETVWSVEEEFLNQVCCNKFRTMFDVNQYLMKYWQYMEGKYVPQSPDIGRFYTIGKEDQQIYDAILHKRCKMICLNDDSHINDFDKEKDEIIAVFNQAFSKKSSFEK